jgi:SAM-dependent methyltransferase
MSNDRSTNEQLNLWAAGVANEIKFWSWWVKQAGGKWPDDYAERMGGKKEFPHRLASLFDVGQHIDVLDVGAGPVSILGPKCTRNSVTITATDPLADAYDWIFERNGLQPPIRTKFAPAEDLISYFPVNSFDLVYCRNALDHSFDPVRGIECMLAVCKPEGFVVLEHYNNEAEKAGYEGLHQFNFDGENGDFVVWNKKYRCNVTAHFARIASVKFTPSVNNKSHTVTIRKRQAPEVMQPSPLDPQTNRFLSKMREIVVRVVGDISETDAQTA